MTVVYEPFVLNDPERFRTRRLNLVIISGKAGAGKTESAKYLTAKLELYKGLRVKHTSFALPIKDIAASIFKWDGKKDDRGRKLLQVIGTEAGREYNPNIWVEYLEDRELSDVFPNHFVLVDDWRYPNERDYFLNNLMYDVTTIRIERPNNPYLIENGMSHISENSLPSDEEHLIYDNSKNYNFTVLNDREGDLQNLRDKLDWVLSYLVTNKIVAY